MTEQPSTFTVPKTGRYHFISGQQPHLVEDCANACEAAVTLAVMAGSEVQLMDSGTFVKIPMDTAIVYDAR